MRRAVRVLTATASVAVVALLGACAAGGNRTATEPTRAHAGATASGTPTPTGPVELTAATFADTLGAAMTKAASYDFTMKLTAQGQAVTAQGSAEVGTSATPTLAMTMTIADQGTIEMRFVGGKAYMSMPQLTEGKFFVIDPKDASNPLASSFDQLSQQSDPAQSIREIKDAVVSVEKAGAPVQLDGVAAQPYDVTVDPTKIASLQSQLDSTGVKLPATLTYRYWVGPDNRLRRLTTSVLGTTVDMSFSHWGSGAPVTAPSADQITDSPF